jgi:hypothetical protein
MPRPTKSARSTAARRRGCTSCRRRSTRCRFLFFRPSFGKKRDALSDDLSPFSTIFSIFCRDPKGRLRGQPEKPTPAKPCQGVARLGCRCRRHPRPPSAKCGTPPLPIFSRTIVAGGGAETSQTPPRHGTEEGSAAMPPIPSRQSSWVYFTFIIDYHYR